MMELETGWISAPPLAAPPPRGPTPWEDPEVFAPAGFFRTLGEVLFHPGEFFARLGPGGVGEPLAFALIVSTTGLLAALFWQLLAPAAGGLPSPEPAGLAALEGGLGGLLVLMAAIPLLVLVDLGVGALCWWGGLALIGVGRDFTPTWRILCYAQAGLALAVIPSFGLTLAGLWILVLMFWGAKKVYGISAWGALGALAAFIGLNVLVALALLVGLMLTAALLGFLLLLA
jgi:hypothetical protein